MKKIRLFFLFISIFSLIGTSVFSQSYQQISLKEATIAAEYRMAVLNKNNLYIIDSQRYLMNNDHLLAFVFDILPTGYIVVSASFSLPPVLAYSFESKFGDFKVQNPLFSMLVADITKRIIFSETPGNHYAENNEQIWNLMLRKTDSGLDKQTLEQWPADSDGWLKTNWTQNSPYNLYCPIDPVTSQRSIAGCPAVAMAQIVNFHRSTNYVQFNDVDDYYHNYAGRQYWIDNDYLTMDFPSYPQLNEYLDTLNSHYVNGFSLTNQDKAALTFACGVACTQVYTSQGSGTYGVSQAYNAYLRFGFSTVSLLDENDNDLYDRLKQNIKDTLPAHLAVVDSLWSIGHNVVVDGYNTYDYYHINFGWGSAYNGWYLLPDDIPYEMNVVEGIVVDIIPIDYSGIQSETNQKGNISVYPNPTSDVLTISLCGFQYNKINFNLFDINGRMVKTSVVSDTTEFQIDTKDLSCGMYMFILTSETQIIDRGKIVIE